MTTVGVAIAVPEPWGEQLQSYRAALGDPTAEGIPTHITLVPPFDTAADAVPAIEQHLAEAATRHGSFKVHLRGTGTFQPVSPVVFVVVVEGISSCELLAAEARRGPLDLELAFPYHPHVTVAHNLTADRLDRAFDELGQFECEFEADHVSLYVDEGVFGWRRTRDFDLVRRTRDVALAPDPGPLERT